MPVDSFKFLPRLIAYIYQMTEREPELPIPWTALQRPLAQSKFALITSGGLYQEGVEPPFDLKREKTDPTWGDPTYRTIPTDIKQAQVRVSHLHINPEAPEADLNVLLPIHRFQELVREGRIGALADKAYSFMGFQGYPPDARQWREKYGPELAQKLKADGVNCVFLTPA